MQGVSVLSLMSLLLLYYYILSYIIIYYIILLNIIKYLPIISLSNGYAQAEFKVCRFLEYFDMDVKLTNRESPPGF